MISCVLLPNKSAREVKFGLLKHEWFGQEGKKIEVNIQSRGSSNENCVTEGQNVENVGENMNVQASFFPPKIDIFLSFRARYWNFRSILLLLYTAKKKSDLTWKLTLVYPYISYDMHPKRICR